MRSLSLPIGSGSLLLFLTACQLTHATDAPSLETDMAREILSAETTRPAPVERQARPASQVRTDFEKDPAEYAPTPDRPLRACLRTTHADGTSFEQYLTRSADQLHLLSPAPATGERPAREWHFTRNPLVRAEFTGWLVDPSIGYLLQHNYMDLIHRGIANSWQRLVGCGVRQADLEALLLESVDAPRQTAFGLEFVRLRPHPGTGPAGLSELWWNAQYQLPLELRGTGAAGEWVQRLVELSFDPDPRWLGDAGDCYPDFTIFDIVDFQDAHEEHGHAHEAAGNVHP